MAIRQLRKKSMATRRNGLPARNALVGLHVTTPEQQKALTSWLLLEQDCDVHDPHVDHGPLPRGRVLSEAYHVLS